MELTFYIAAAIATAATFMVIVSVNAVHALLYLIVSFLAVATIFFVLGAPFAAALEVIVYAGAIVVLFVFVAMMLNVTEDVKREKRWLGLKAWIGPCLLAGLLLAAILRALLAGDFSTAGTGGVESKAVGIALYGPYVLVVELASMLLLAGFIGAYHLGRREREEERF